MLVEETRNGAFVYRDAFFAEVAGERRHSRASVSELRELLLPKKNVSPLKDQVAHWYEAQLIHYGLSRTKDKNTAKVRLTAALTSGTLAVPSDIQQIEAGLKREYASAQRKAKIAANKKELKASGSTSTGNKRKISQVNNGESASTTNLRVQVGDLTFEIDHQTAPSPQRIPKQQKRTPKKEKEESNAKRSTTVRGTSSTSKAKSQRFPTLSPRKVITKKQTARKSSSPVSPTYSSIAASPHRGYPARNPRGNEDTEPPPPYSVYDDENHYSSNYNNTHVVQISGFYSISTSATDDEDTLSLRLLNSRDQLWGRFNIGGKSGIVRMDGINGIGKSIRKSFGWRSEDSETGELRFGKGCDGWIEFDGNGNVRGVFHGLVVRRDVEFEGHIREDYGYEGDNERAEVVNDIVSQWHEYPDRAYGRR